MQDKHLFEYAVIRIMPRVERGEFLNVGVVLYCKSQQFLKVSYTLDSARLQASFPGLDLNLVNNHLEAFQQIAEGVSKTSPIAALDPGSRFRWLTARRSTILQTSEVHPGFCGDAAQTLVDLHRKLVEL